MDALLRQLEIVEQQRRRMPFILGDWGRASSGTKRFKNNEAACQHFTWSI
jgi:hypothetical protein